MSGPTAYKKDARSYRPGAHPSQNQETGTLLEQLVIIDALKAGYRVFRPIDGNAPYDLVLDDGERRLRIEVKARHKRSLAKLGEKCDGLATVDPQNRIEWSFAPGMLPRAGRR